MAVKDLISAKENIHQARHLYARALDSEKLGRVESACSFL